MTQDELREKIMQITEKLGNWTAYCENPAKYPQVGRNYIEMRYTDDMAVNDILSLIQQVERNAVDNVLDELLEWYDIKSQMSAQPFNWNGAVKALKASRDHKKPFNVLKAELENKK